MTEAGRRISQTVVRGRWFALALFLGVTWVLGRIEAATSGGITWRARDGRMSARFEGTELGYVLGKVAGATGWRVFVEPGTGKRVSVRFQDATAGEALKLILGDVSFALVPQSSGPSRLYVFLTSMDRATEAVSALKPGPERPAKALPTELVVMVKPGSKVDVEALARRLKGKVAGRIGENGSYRLQFPDEATALAAEQALAMEPGIEIDYNFPVDRPVRSDGGQSGALPLFNLKPRVNADGKNVIVGLIDTPVQSLSDDMNAFILPSLQIAGPAPDLTGQLSHGTSMAATLLHGLNTAPQETGGSSVRILPVDVYGPNEDTTTFDVARGIYAAINNGATVINMSLSGDGDSALLQALIRDARRQGVLFFGAAGNVPTTAPTYPAAYPEVVAVTAGDRRGEVAPYANRGAFVDVIAPGTSLVQFGGDSFLVTGTSPATAFVSGAAAGYRAAGNTPEQIETMLKGTPTLKPPTGAASTPRSGGSR